MADVEAEGARKTVRETLVAWTKSPGFAAVHNGRATDEQIVDDLLQWLKTHDLVLVAAQDLVDAESRWWEKYADEQYNDVDMTDDD